MIAVENAQTRSFVTPKDLEPQQRISHYASNGQYAAEGDYFRRLSVATTMADARYQAQHQHDKPAGFFATEMPGAQKSQYAQDNILQNHHVFVPQRQIGDIGGDQYWIVYIHGGYFRDPKVDATSFRTTLEILTDQHVNLGESQPRTLSPAPSSSGSSTETLADQNNSIRTHIAGYAAVNYRLAPHPAYPQDAQTETYVRRNAQFPDQLRDVHASIRHLQMRYGFGSNYILCGHSVGATLALLATLKSSEGQIKPPVCVVGANGIYDFPQIHKDNPVYESMTRNAIPPTLYEQASPACYASSEYASIRPEQPLRVLLSHSRNDGLVDWEQVEIMQKVLQSDSVAIPSQVKILETKGQHDAIWKEGKELARSLVEAVKMLTQ